MDIYKIMPYYYSLNKMSNYYSLYFCVAKIVIIIIYNMNQIENILVHFYDIRQYLPKINKTRKHNWRVTITKV